MLKLLGLFYWYVSGFVLLVVFSVMELLVLVDELVIGIKVGLKLILGDLFMMKVIFVVLLLLFVIVME